MLRKATYIFLLLPIFIGIVGLIILSRPESNSYNCFEDQYKWVKPKYDYFPVVKGESEIKFQRSGNISRKIYEKDTIINSKKYGVYKKMTYKALLNKEITLQEKEYFCVSKEGVFVYYKATDDEQMLFDHHAKVGDKWQFFGIDLELKSKNAFLSTPTCNYKNLLKLSLTVGGGTAYYYYDKKLGLIGTESNDRLDSYFKGYTKAKQ